MFGTFPLHARGKGISGKEPQQLHLMSTDGIQLVEPLVAPFGFGVEYVKG